MVECIAITHMTLFIIGAIWVLLSIICLWKYPFRYDQEHLAWYEMILVLFIFVGIFISLLFTCIIVGWFLFSFIPSLICIKIVS